VILDGILAFAGDDDDVFDAGRDAFFHNVLICGLSTTVAFLGLRFVPGQKARAEAGGGQYGFANFRVGGGLCVGCFESVVMLSVIVLVLVEFAAS